MTLAVPARRELARLRRLRKLGLILAVVAAFMWSRILSGRGPLPTISLGDDAVFWLPVLVIISLLAAVMILPMLGQGRSPHVAYRPEQIEVGFQDVKGLGKVVVEVAHTLKVLLDHGNFRDELGGNPRRGILFEGAPGTGKTHLAKAMAKEANVPFLFVSATAFKSMWYGMTARRIRAFFRALRKAPAE